MFPPSAPPVSPPHGPPLQIGVPSVRPSRVSGRPSAAAAAESPASRRLSALPRSDLDLPPGVTFRDIDEQMNMERLREEEEESMATRYNAAPAPRAMAMARAEPPHGNPPRDRAAAAVPSIPPASPTGFLPLDNNFDVDADDSSIPIDPKVIEQQLRIEREIYLRSNRPSSSYRHLTPGMTISLPPPPPGPIPPVAAGAAGWGGRGRGSRRRRWNGGRYGDGQYSPSRH